MTQELETMESPTGTDPRAGAALDVVPGGQHNILWERFKDALRGRLSQQAYATWVPQMTCLLDDGHTLTIGLPNLFSLDWVNNHYRHVLEEELQKISGDASLELLIFEPDPEDAADEITSSPPSPAPAKGDRPRPLINASGATEPPATTLNRRYTFSTFVTGPSNQLASAAAQQVADKPGFAYNPLFIFGRVGLGKTHLLQAIGHAILKKNAAARVQYLTTEQFINDVIQGIRFDRMDEIRKTYRACDVLLIDDIQFIAGKETCQTEFFHTFNALYDARKQMVVTSDKLPHEIKDLEERVKTRFQWGLIVDLQPPELETRVAIVRKKAETDGILLEDDVAMFIAQTVRSNVRELEGCLIRISAYASLQNKPISIAIAKDVLKDVIAGKGQAVTCETIVKSVATHFDVKVGDLKSTKRGRAIALPRQIAMYLCRKHTSSSYPEIGQALGGKDHTTALNAFNRIKERLDTPEVRRHVEEIERLLLD
jgi:chromosomal replication initiator protein